MRLFFASRTVSSFERFAMKFEYLLNPNVAEVRNAQVVRIGGHGGYLDSVILVILPAIIHGQAVGKSLILPKSSIEETRGVP